MSKGDLLRKRGWSIHSEATMATEATDDELKLGADLADDEQKIVEAATFPIPPDVVKDIAKARLSKWAARLFDPDRPRGLVQAPQVIPLNDEFLQEFGRREKDFNQATGKVLEIETRIDDVEVDELVDSQSELPSHASRDKSFAERKLKIWNLKYTTTEAMLVRACEAFGKLEKVNLIMGDGGMNKGRAYVTFERSSDAEACRTGLKELQGRKLGVETAPDLPRRTTATPRYYARDISTKCYNCGQVGHQAIDCSNDAVQKACPLCASIEHDDRSCPMRQVCFQCGLPGHLIRDCPEKGERPRIFCSRCERGDHSKFRCPWASSPPDKEVNCMRCGKAGHYLCRRMLQWTSQMAEVSCAVCGDIGHTSAGCQRPNLEQCIRDDLLVEREIDRVGSSSTRHESTTGKRRWDQDSSNPNGRKGKQPRAKSAPPRRR